MKVLISSRKPLAGPDSSVDYCGFSTATTRRASHFHTRFPRQLARALKPHLQFPSAHSPSSRRSCALVCYFVFLPFVFYFSCLPSPWLQILYELLVSSPLPSFWLKATQLSFSPLSLQCSALAQVQCTAQVVAEQLLVSSNSCFQHQPASKYLFTLNFLPAVDKGCCKMIGFKRNTFNCKCFPKKQKISLFQILTDSKLFIPVDIFLVIFYFYLNNLQTIILSKLFTNYYMCNIVK